MQIVEATTEDAASIRHIQTETFLDTYPNAGLGITRDDIKAKTDQWNTEGDQRIIRLMTTLGAKTWVAKEGDNTVGFIGIMKTDDSAKIDALHVLPEFQGQGVGKALLQTALEYLDGVKVSMEVVKYNARAIKFYENFGFKVRGDAIDNPLTLPNGKVIPRMVMVKE